MTAGRWNKPVVKPVQRKKKERGSGKAIGDKGNGADRERGKRYDGTGDIRPARAPKPIEVNQGAEERGVREAMSLNLP